MILNVRDVLNNDLDKNSVEVKEMFEIEDNLDLVQKEISDLVTEVLTQDLSYELTLRAKNQLAYADEFESISDYFTVLTKLYLKLKNNEMTLDKAEREDLLKLHNQVEEYFNFVTTAIDTGNDDIVIEAVKRRGDVTFAFKSIREAHLNRLKEKKKDVFYSTTYIDMLTTYRRIKTHIYHVCEVMVGEKAI